MNIIDTHVHLYDEQFKNDIDNVIKRGLEFGIKHFYLPSLNKNTIKPMLELEKRYYNICYPMIGLHPIYVHPKTINLELDIINNLLNKHYFVAIGEIGIDLHKNKQFLHEQKYAFSTQISWAKKKKLPIVIHSRKAFNEIFNILEEEYSNSTIKGIFHCFYGTLKQANKIINFGLKLGIGGIITYNNNNIDKFLSKIPLESIVMETDAPYLTPEPYRNKRNEPFYLKFILNKISKIYGLSSEEIAIITTKNVYDIFKTIL
ncbi:MAG: TatD family hydrolase [Candidatus Bostrichicola ureolyticus]|nr:MAG: TatD family hydrolase [Candidatus Bostrichicola ureolyticus]